MPGPPQQHRTPYWYRHSYHHHHHPHPQPSSLQYFAPPDLEYVQKRTSNKESRFTRQKSGRERPRPASISDLQYSVLDASPTSSIPSQTSTGSSSDTSVGSPQSSTDTGIQTDTSHSSSELSNLDQSCSSLPSQAGSGGSASLTTATSASSQLSPDQGFHEAAHAQIPPPWRRNGKFVNFFRSFIGPKPKEKVARNTVFGAELTKLLADTGDEVPQVLRICTQFIEEFGVINGIYRASGISSNIQRIKTLFDEQRVPRLAGDAAVLHDIHCVSSVLKLYFRQLPTPLVTYDLYPHLVLASKQSEPRRGEKYREILQRLPGAHYRTMDWLMRHLYRMSLQSERTGMTSKNLAIVWSPNILRCDVSELDTQDALQDVSLQAVITEFLIRCAGLVFAPAIPPAVASRCCCHCDHGTKEAALASPPPSHTVTFAPTTTTTTAGPAEPGQLKPVLKNSGDNNHNSSNNNHASSSSSKKVELRVNPNPNRPRPRSVAVPNPATGSNTVFRDTDLRHMVSLPVSQVEPVQTAASAGGQKTDSNGNAVKQHSVTFHTVLDRPAPDKKAAAGPGEAAASKYKKGGGQQSWRSIFSLGQPLARARSGPGQQEFSLRGSHREINIDEAILPDNKPLNFRPRPRSEVNLAYSIQDSTLLLTPLKNNEFQVSTTNQFSYLPYQQHLLNCNHSKPQQHQQQQQPFARTSKLRQNFNKRGLKAGAMARPKSVDFEVLQSLENICRCQPLAYSSGLLRPGHPGCEAVVLGLAGPGHHPHLRASQREKHGHVMGVGEWTNVHATRV